MRYPYWNVDIHPHIHIQREPQFLPPHKEALQKNSFRLERDLPPAPHPPPPISGASGTGGQGQACPASRDRVSNSLIRGGRAEVQRGKWTTRGGARPAAEPGSAFWVNIHTGLSLPTTPPYHHQLSEQNCVARVYHCLFPLDHSWSTDSAKLPHPALAGLTCENMQEAKTE